MTAQRTTIHVLLFSLVTLSAACSHKSSPCGEAAPLIAGKGCGQFVLGVTNRSEALPNRAVEEQFSESGLFFEFDSDNKLSALAVTSPAFREKSGIRVGDPEDNVVARNGKAKVGDLKLMKGDTVIGSVGDRVLAYSGVEFVISHDKLWAIRVMRD